MLAAALGIHRVPFPKPARVRGAAVFESRSQNNSYTPAPFFSGGSARRFSRKKGVPKNFGALRAPFLRCFSVFPTDKRSKFSGRATRARDFFPRRRK